MMGEIAFNVLHPFHPSSSCHANLVLYLILMFSSRVLRGSPHIRLRASIPTTLTSTQPRGFATPSVNGLFANGTNTYYMEEMYWH